MKIYTEKEKERKRKRKVLYDKGHYRENRERLLQYSKDWAKRNPDVYKRAIERWNKRNPEKIKNNNIKWRINNPEKQKEATLNWRSKHPEKVKIQYTNKKLRQYGLSIPQWEQLKQEQNYSCPICGVHEKDLGNCLVIDHNHSTGQVRGLLCGMCNRGLGHFKDDPKLLSKAIQYLKKERIVKRKRRCA